MTTEVLKLAAFSDGDRGGNPAGVWIGDALPDDAVMQQIAADIGFSETAFAAPVESGWRVRYFSPLAEVPFAGMQPSPWAQRWRHSKAMACFS